MRKYINQILIFIGIILLTIGMTFSITNKYYNRAFQSVNINMEKEYDKEKMQELIKDIMGDKTYEIEYFNIYEKEFRIKANEITEEEKVQLVEKINETFEEKLADVNINNYPARNTFENARTYIMYAVVILIVTALVNNLLLKLEEKAQEKI